MSKYAIQYSIEEIIILDSALKAEMAKTQDTAKQAQKKGKYFAQDYYLGKAQKIQSMITKAEMAEML
jgi:hypothetical protein